MHWFRIAALICISLTVLMAITFTAVVISMCTNTSHQKAMDTDPNYNNTIGPLITICIIQVCFITCSCLSYYISYINWRNNYQMDHGIRRKFILWMFLWTLFCLIDLGIAIFLIVKGKEPQEEMSSLYELFSRYNQDTKFVGQFERYQRENSCCGIYGPDDWLMVQLRSSMGGGGGGGGYQSLDYGFRQNPSTGKCHLTPPTIPMGCGRKILEDLHIMMATFAGIMILQVLVGLAAACFAGYSFFYWLEKEVIVIPEDEVSNLIILEPESSTSTNVSGGKYLNAGSGAPYLGPPPDDRYIRASQMGSRSRGSSYLGEGSGTGSGSNRTHRTAESIPTGVYPNLQASIPSSSRKSGGSGGGGSSGAPPGSSMPLPSGMVPPGSSYPPGVVPTGTIPPGYPGGPSQAPTNVPQQEIVVIPSAAPQGSRMPPGVVGVVGVGQSTRVATPVSHRATYIYQAPVMQAQSVRTSQRNVIIPAGSSMQGPAPTGSVPGGGQIFIATSSGTPGKPHSQKHMLHAQEAALGGKVLGEVHIDHKQDAEKTGLVMDSKGGHHATLAIVRNKNAPKPKKFFALAAGAGKGHHGQTGHLAEDIAEMTGNPDIIRHKVDDVLLPVEHGNLNLPPGGYLKALDKRRKEELKLEEEARIGSGSGSVSGFDACNILSGFLEPEALVKAEEKKMEELGTPMIQPHLASAILVPLEGAAAGSHQDTLHINSGSHQNAHYLNPGSHVEPGSHQGAHYLNAGSHENAHYIQGSHQNAHYINHHPGSHEHAHYMNAGSHENAHYMNAGSHENAHYIHPGSHENAHYMNAGSHENAHYMNAGSHENAHYINHPGWHQKAHYFDRESHENSHYVNRGSHQNAHYINRGEHQHAHYIDHNDMHGRGSHQNAHYLNRGSHENEHGHKGKGSHQDAHYINRGSHQNAHYLNQHHEVHHVQEHHGHGGSNEHQDHHGHGSNEHQNHHDHGSNEHQNHHEQGSHHNAHYIKRGSHQNAHYLEKGAHQNAHYLEKGAHANAHYLEKGAHQNAHYLEKGAHQNAHYVGKGAHQNADYINQHHDHEHSPPPQQHGHEEHGHQGKGHHSGGKEHDHEREHEHDHHKAKPPHHSTVDATRHQKHHPPTSAPKDNARYISELKAIERSRNPTAGTRTIKTGFLGGIRGTNDINPHHIGSVKGNEFDRVTAQWTGSVRTVILYRNPNPLRDDD